ncbi:hypothetical protein B0A80_02490 [Flavobacterium tructae]|uniref:hypothetical protein n=1 Tax=Flavobacterium tructae TaxID=1114873 RepID=UPI000B5BF361|nr:hypothetical protein [Flavobacterium tructae]OXB25118.1 hypothetical protein B0A80_02490 [Flavobacterium tructae]
MTLFKQQPLVNLFNAAKQRTEASVRYRSDEEFFSFPKEKLIELFMRDEKIEHLQINLEDRTSDVQMIPIPAEHFPAGYDVRRGEKYPLARVRYSYKKPVKDSLLNYLPKGVTFNKNVDFSVGSDKLHIYYQTHYANENLSDEVKKEVRDFMIELHDEINNIVKTMNAEIDAFNIELKENIESWIDDRIEKIALKNKQNEDLNNF